ncbi:MAG: tRNA pseudouridine(38-40) synthase TruA [Candidatus Eisenbacteria bacterium]|nr:tRNA pseudouridine(38-40) synthase TruA [Candidatus Eisenbacteria bacterium]
MDESPKCPAQLRNLKLVLEYDGSEFHGWQIQRRERTVQGVLEEALARLLGSPHRVVAASRTDAGAHARGQVASFHTRSVMPAGRVMLGLNGIFPDDVVVREAGEVGLDFSARRSAKSRLYSYRVVLGPSALWRGHAWSVRRPLKLSAMEEACRGIIGLRDFRAFSGIPEQGDSTLCTVIESAWREWSGGYVFEIEADRFIIHMIRTLAGTMVRLGEGKLSVNEFVEALHTRTRPKLGMTAPARGLCLEAVKYD